MLGVRTDNVWPPISQKIPILTLGAATSPAAIVAMVVVVVGHKMSASTEGIYLGDWPHRRWLAGIRKCPQSGCGARKPTTKNVPPVASVEALSLVVGPGW